MPEIKWMDSYQINNEVGRRKPKQVNYTTQMLTPKPNKWRI
jgi:hypothetical protein